jgi:hypothetical protein
MRKMNKAPIPINAPDKFVLSEGEKNHPLWLRLKAHLEERLSTLRVLNDKVQDEASTAALRGAVAEVKRLINLDRPHRAIE